MSSFQLYSQYYDLFYADKDTASECKYVSEVLEDNGVLGKRWLEFGAGSGRHGQVFRSMGVDWHGLEISPDMAKKGLSQKLAIKVGDIRKEEYSSTLRFDAVLALFHVVSYLHRNQDVVSTFQNVFRHLKPGGLFFFDFWYTPAVYMQLPEQRVKRAETNHLEINRKAIPTVHWNNNTVNVHYQITVRNKETGQMKSFEEDHLMRHFSLPEIELLSEIAGFQLIMKEEWLTKNTPGKDTWGVACLLKKPE